MKSVPEVVDNVEHVIASLPVTVNVIVADVEVAADDARKKVSEYIADGATCPILYPLGDVYATIDAFTNWNA